MWSEPTTIKENSDGLPSNYHLTQHLFCYSRTWNRFQNIKKWRAPLTLPFSKGHEFKLISFYKATDHFLHKSHHQFPVRIPNLPHGPPTNLCPSGVFTTPRPKKIPVGAPNVPQHSEEIRARHPRPNTAVVWSNSVELGPWVIPVFGAKLFGAPIRSSEFFLGKKPPGLVMTNHYKTIGKW
jgi:hypothetical protein